MEINNKYFAKFYRHVNEACVHIASLSNHVSLSYVFNAMLALRAKPSRYTDFFDAREAALANQAVVITFDSINNELLHSAEGVLYSNACANSKVVLDPGGVNTINYRLQRCLPLLALDNIHLIRGTAPEIVALASNRTAINPSYCTDEFDYDHKVIFSSASALSKKFNCIIVVNGKEDLICDYGRYYFLQNGHKWISRISGLGTLMSHFLAVGLAANSSFKIKENNKTVNNADFDAAVAMVSIFNYIAEVTAAKTNNFAEFAQQFLVEISLWINRDVKDYPQWKPNHSVTVW